LTSVDSAINKIRLARELTSSVPTALSATLLTKFTTTLTLSFPEVDSFISSENAKTALL